MPRQTIERYFANLGATSGWEASLADDMTFTSFAADGDRVVALTRYQHRPR